MMQPTKPEGPAPISPALGPNAGSSSPVRFEQRRLTGAIGFVVALCLVFFQPLRQLVQFALSAERNSYLLLIPAISAYLVWIKRREIRGELRSSVGPAVIPLVIGVIALGCAGMPLDKLDALSLRIFAFLNFFVAGAFFFLGVGIIRQIAFPLGFLIFMTPMPTIFADAIEVFLQHTSAEAAYWMLSIARVPMLRDGLDFLMPGVAIRVAQECSGYNSTFALFMVSTLAGYLYLKSPWRRSALALAVVPLAILRNGFRITTIALLCVHVDPQMIHSYIHHKGGPIFFALSLIPFFALLWYMRKSEIRKSGRQIDSK
jgi:exosortase C (VPDSG-CTERM-specific)